MTGSLGFTVTELVRRPEPVVPDPFLAALEPSAATTAPRSAGGRAACRRLRTP